MIKKITFILTLLVSCSYYGQVKINDFDDAQIYFKGLFPDNSQLDDYGNTYIDMGSASSGRIYFRITDVNIEKEERGEEPGCADICPPRIILSFKCRKSSCLRDPSNVNEIYKSGNIEFLNTNKGKKAFEYLIALKEYFRKNI